MQLNLINAIPVYGFIFNLIVDVQAYVQCGSKLCHGNTAQCCSWDEHECCWLSWSTLWWIWVAAIVFMAIVISMLVCCFSKQRRKSSVRHMIIVPPLNHYNYGSIPSTPTSPTPPFKYEMRSQLSVKT